MTLTIPSWILYVIGAAGGFALFALAAFGVLALVALWAIADALGRR